MSANKKAGVLCTKLMFAEKADTSLPKAVKELLLDEAIRQMKKKGGQGND